MAAPLSISHDYFFDITGRFDLAFKLQGPFHIAYLEQTARDIHIFTGHCIFDIVESNACSLHADIIYIDLELTLRCTYKVNPVDLRQRFQLVLQLIGIFFKAHHIQKSPLTFTYMIG